MAIPPESLMGKYLIPLAIGFVAAGLYAFAKRFASFLP
jgi:hypothetical protein